jgi:thiamine kinase
VTPEQIAADYFHIDAHRFSVTRIKDGLTNDSYRVTGASTPVVVRISNADDRALFIDRHSEAVVLKLVEQAGIGAPVFHNAPDKHVLITAEIPGRNPARMEMREPHNILRVAALLRRLHALVAPNEVQTMKLENTLHGYWALLGQWRDHATALEIARESDQQLLRRLCHNDVHHMNLIDDDVRLWLLDWEYAGVGDPYFDLASVCCYHGFDEARQQSLLAAYAPTESVDTARLMRMCWLFDYIKELWFEARRLA